MLTVWTMRVRESHDAFAGHESAAKYGQGWTSLCRTLLCRSRKSKL